MTKVKKMPVKDIKRQVSLEVVTPKMAEKWLKDNPENRNPTSNLIKKYTEEMTQGKWHETNATIGICEDGSLMDGQHRLNAIIRSGMAQEMIIVRNIQKSALIAIDIGKKRSLHDLLTIKGYKYTTQLSSAVRLIALFNKEKEIPVSVLKSYTNIGIDELFETIKENPSLQDDASYVMGEYKTLIKRAGAGTVIALYYLFKEKDKSLAEEFFTALNTGHMLDMNSTIYHCREKIIRLKEESDMGRYRNPGQIIFLLVQTWNFWRNGLRDRRLVDVNKEPIPVII